jgi:hypothetical protein
MPLSCLDITSTLSFVNNIIFFNLNILYFYIYVIFCCCFRETLLGIAKHYETGETLPEDVYLKLVAARTYRAGSQSLRQVSMNELVNYTFSISSFQIESFIFYSFLIDLCLCLV